jgi:hypothetical protein
MKNIKTVLILFLTLGILSFIPNNQTAQDSKDFLKEKIAASNPIPSYNNFVYFNDILKYDAEFFAGIKLTDEQFKHLFIYGRECHMNENRSSNIWMTTAEVIDIRGITKVSVTRVTSKHNVCEIKVYLSGGYLSKKYTKAMGQDAKWESIPHMMILIGDNEDLANKIKKAIIHLGQFYGVQIKDGDLY